MELMQMMEPTIHVAADYVQNMANFNVHACTYMYNVPFWNNLLKYVYFCSSKKVQCCDI